MTRHRARVLIVDDSRTMRALFAGLLERSPDIDVVGLAASADEARDLIRELQPNVMSLDVEMPGLSGLDFLSELMATRPMPVIMLSAVAQCGSPESDRALELGAFACFPKPLCANQKEFDRLATAFVKLVLNAANGRKPPRIASGEAALVKSEAA